MNDSSLQLEKINATFGRFWNAVSWGIILVVLVLALVVIKPAMPSKVVLLTGREGAAYHEMGIRLAKDLRKRGLEAEVVTTGGSLENLRRLDGTNNLVALAPSNVDWESVLGESSPLVALGSIASEPTWIFCRSDLKVSQISDLNGRKVATEGVETTSHQFAQSLIVQMGYGDRIDLVPLSESTVIRALEGFKDQTIDAVFVSGQPASEAVQSLLHSDDTHLLSIRRAKAFAKRVPGMTVIVAPEGVFDLARNVPAQDAQLLASATCLIAHEDIHPALVPMLLASVENVHQESTTFITAVRFPSSEHVTLPLASAANRYFRQGEVGLAKVLPYGVVRFLNHIGFLVLPLLTVAVVLLKSIPAGLKISANMRIKGWMRRLESVEKGHASGTDVETLLAELEQLDSETAARFMPRSMAHEYVDFRQFLHDMRDRVQTPGEHPPAADA